MIHFILCDGPVISDLIRIVIYTYLLFDCFTAKLTAPPFGDTPLQAHLLLKYIHPLFWCVKNKFSQQFLILHNYECLKRLVLVTKISWVCCIVGFGGIITRLLTGIFVFILSTTIIGIGKIGIRHRWYIPTWTLLALIFTKFQTYSVDHLITQYIDHRYNLESTHVIFDSGFASKFIQCISLYTLFAAGVSKIRQAGINWMHPGTLIFYLSDPTLNDFIVLSKIRNTLRKYIIQYPFIVMLMAISSLFIELSAIFGIFLASTRLPIVILACSFHFGILFVLGPNFLPQCICYLMIIDIPFSTKLSQMTTVISLFDVVIMSIGTIIIVGYLLSLLFNYEGWPFTAVPMFSLDRRQFTHDYLIDENQLKQLSKEFPLSNGISIGCEDQFSFGETWIRITKNEEQVNLIKDICFHLCPFEFAFRHCLLTALIRSIVISKTEMDVFLNNIFDLLVSNDIQFVKKNEYLNVDIHFKQGWKTYATTERTNKLE